MQLRHQWPANKAVRYCHNMTGIQTSPTEVAFESLQGVTDGVTEDNTQKNTQHVDKAPLELAKPATGTHVKFKERPTFAYVFDGKLMFLSEEWESGDAENMSK